jgi:hypothetical protein
MVDAKLVQVTRSRSIEPNTLLSFAKHVPKIRSQKKRDGWSIAKEATLGGRGNWSPAAMGLKQSLKQPLKKLLKKP